MKAGWQRTRLGDRFKTATGSTPSKSNPAFFGGEIPLVKPPELLGDEIENAADSLTELGAAEARLLPEGSILVSCIGILGKVGIASVPVSFNQQINAILPRLDQAFPRFMFYQTLSPNFQDQLRARSAGTTVPIVNKSKFNEIEIVLPPLNEQRRIVAVLDKAFASIATATANAQKNLINARALFESYLHSILVRRGEGWTDEEIASLADTALGKMLDKQKNKGTLQPYLRNINVRWFDFDLNDLLQMRFEESEESRYSVRRGDVVICEGGYPGRAAIWTKDEAIYYQKALHRVRFKGSAMANWFVYLLYYADAVGDLKSHFTGAGIQHFTGQALKKFEIPVPPVDQLASLIARIDLVFEKTRLAATKYEAKLDALGELKQSLLQKAFAGELT